MKKVAMNRISDLVLRLIVVVGLAVSLTVAGTMTGSESGAFQGAQRFDVLIKGGRVFDGSGNPWFRADVGVRDGKIAAIGDLSDADAARIIDAAGMAVAPGFIDIHSHSDGTLPVDGTAQSKVRQGVTLDVGGERASVAPLAGEVLEERRSSARSQGYELDWTDLDGYFEHLLRKGISLNVAIKVAPQQIKRIVVGGSVEQAATPEQLERMKQLIVEAMHDGAIGIASWFRGGGYRFAEEMIPMAQAAVDHGAVVYETHVGSEGYQLEEELQKAIDIVEQTGLPVSIAHFKIRGRAIWDRLEPAIRMIEAARQRGLDVTANQYPYTAMTQGWSNFFPTWAREAEDLEELLGSTANRGRIRNDPEWIQYFEEHGGIEGVVLCCLRNDSPVKQYDGMSVAEIAAQRGDPDPINALFEVVMENGRFPGGIHHNQSEENVRRIMALPWVAIASDGWAVRPDGVLGEGVVHPRLYGTFPRVLGRYVRDQPLLTLADAIRKMTSLPAQVLRLEDRGRLLPGYWADIVVFDPGTVIDVATYEEPHQYSIGVDYVLVNGVVVIDDGEHTGARPGQPVYGPGRRATH